MKYLFKAELTDGTIYEQTEDDISQTNPEKSAFYDVMDKDLRKFWLIGEGKTYLVNLEDGTFEIDGVKVKIHEGDLAGFRLIYYRTHTHEFAGLQEINHNIEFCIGWQTNDAEGKNVKHIIRIN